MAATVAMAHDGILDPSEYYGSVLIEHGLGNATGEPLKGADEMYGSFFENPELLKTNPKYTVAPNNSEDDWKYGEFYQSIYLGSVEVGG